MSKNMSISTMLKSDKGMVKKAMENIEEEIVEEQVNMVRDYLKGAYRFKNEKETEIIKLREEVEKIDEAITTAKDGDLSELKMLSIPAKYLSENTVRLNNMDWDIGDHS